MALTPDILLCSKKGIYILIFVTAWEGSAWPLAFLVLNTCGLQLRQDVARSRMPKVLLGSEVSMPLVAANLSFRIYDVSKDNRALYGDLAGRFRLDALRS